MNLISKIEEQKRLNPGAKELVVTDITLNEISIKTYMDKGMSYVDAVNMAIQEPIKRFMGLRIVRNGKVRDMMVI